MSHCPPFTGPLGAGDDCVLHLPTGEDGLVKSYRVACRPPEVAPADWLKTASHLCGLEHARKAEARAHGEWIACSERLPAVGDYDPDYPKIWVLSSESPKPRLVYAVAPHHTHWQRLRRPSPPTSGDAANK